MNDRKRKPKLTPAECRYFDEVHRDVIRCNRHPSNIDQAFCDVHDGGLYEDEVQPLIRKKLLVKIPMEDCDIHEGKLLGCSWSVGLTAFAVRTFWPDRFDSKYWPKRKTP